MPMTPPPSPAARPRATRWFVPRSHRLFLVFDDRATAERALADLAAADAAATWFFEGGEGARELDPDAVAGPGRLFSWLFSLNVEFLRDLSRSVAGGRVAVAVPARNQRAADDAARLLRQHGAEALAYTAHGNFIPVTS